ncbi:NAD(P)-binding protein [Wielerella bovis]|uniref:NAD(P)-binding protein n=1 Tax=Wielerella bovis TaxID=2917790 RepID=UPI002019F540|nr:NAD(P)-binding protein [Wielerella bovis]MCG7657367.1 NAD(P)-binding protein [Wielerella bovis]MCG7659588.1 NAD(P)-binding protein [Wielerella bovis]
MNKKLTRRHFLGGSLALAGATVISGCEVPTKFRPVTEQNVQAALAYYPPARTGLRGDHDGSQSRAHSIALGGKNYTLPTETREHYDLVVVGAGISGLVAAYYYQKAKPQAKILIVDNHEDFGGHAVRNEFTVNGRTLITYGGSENIDSPKHGFSLVASQFLRDIGIDYTKFERYFDTKLYTEKWHLQRGIYFNQATFGQTAFVKGKLEVGSQDAAAIIAQFPLSNSEKQLLTQIYSHKAPNYLKNKSRRQRSEYVENTSYYDFLKDTVHLSEGSLKFLQNISSDYWGHDIRAISVQEAFENGYPAVQNLDLSKEDEDKEPYIYHFPDGNASVARLLVRKLIPSVAAGNTMEDVVTAKFDYAKLDLPENNVRIRLNTTALLLENQADGSIATVCAGKDSDDLYRIQAAQCIYAGHATLAARIVHGMPEKQKSAMLSNVKIPMVYAKVALKNARAFQKLGAYHIYAPDQTYCEMMLDYSVNIGDYRAPQTPDEPIVLHMIGIATALEGKTAREKYKNGRRALASKNLDVLKAEVMTQLRPIFALVNENIDDVMADITLNRWAHGYSYEQVGLFDSDESVAENTSTMRRRVGNIFMANSDVAWMPYLQNAVDEGHRAAMEAVKLS